MLLPTRLAGKASLGMGPVAASSAMAMVHLGGAGSTRVPTGGHAVRYTERQPR
jgi:hypothetical protein